MMKITLAVATAAAVLMSVPIATPAKAQGVDVQVGRDRDYYRDRDYRYDRRRHYDSDATVGIGPGGVRIGPRHNCRVESTTVERDGRMITRRERRCD